MVTTVSSTDNRITTNTTMVESMGTLGEEGVADPGDHTSITEQGASVPQPQALMEVNTQGQSSQHVEADALFREVDVQHVVGGGAPAHPLEDSGEGTTQTQVLSIVITCLMNCLRSSLPMLMRHPKSTGLSSVAWDPSCIDCRYHVAVTLSSGLPTPTPDHHDSKMDQSTGQWFPRHVVVPGAPGRKWTKHFLDPWGPCVVQAEG